MPNEPQFWLIKSEGDCYSIDDLKKDKKTSWSGVRNYQARNYMRDGMKVGDLVLYYHSVTKPTGIYGLAKVASKVHVDETQFDRKDEHYDPKSTKEKPLWECVDFAYVEKFNEPITLAELKRDPALAGMYVTRKGDRLSVQPVSKKHFDHILKLAKG